MTYPQAICYCGVTHELTKLPCTEQQVIHEFENQTTPLCSAECDAIHPVLQKGVGQVLPISDS